MSSDGANMTIKKSAVSFSFTLVDGSQMGKNVAAFKSHMGQENRENLAKWNSWNDVQKVIEDPRLKCVRFFLVADLKTLLLALGYKSANGRDVCFICSCDKSRWHMCTFDSKCSPRYSSSECESKLILPPLKAGDPGYKAKPMIDVSVFHGVVFDTLHLFLRVTDQILGRACSSMSKQGITVFLRYCADMGIEDFNLRDPGETAIIKFTKLDKKSRTKMIDKIFRDVAVLKTCSLPQQKAESVARVCCVFMDAFEALSTGINLEVKVKKFVASYCKCYQVNEISNYVHLLLHAPLLFSKYGDISKFQQQSVEKLNSVMSRRYFSQSAANIQQAVIANNRSLFLR